MRAFIVLLLLITAALGPDAGGAQTLTGQTQRRMALGQPALDGLALGGVRLGDAEGAVVALLGSPDATGPSTLAERMLRYELAPDTWLEVHAGASGIRAISVRAVGEPVPRPSLQTMRGIHLGMPLARVLERYGDPAGGRHWYAAEGIAFNLDGPADTVTSILVFPPGMPAP
jgi:hypothetical protein